MKIPDTLNSASLGPSPASLFYALFTPETLFSVATAANYQQSFQCLLGFKFLTQMSTVQSLISTRVNRESFLLGTLGLPHPNIILQIILANVHKKINSKDIIVCKMILNETVTDKACD